MEVLHYNGWTHTSFIDPTIIGSTGGKLLLESSEVWLFYSICWSPIIANRLPLRLIFRVWSSQKSLG
jgi:hypothetical protein